MSTTARGADVVGVGTMAWLILRRDRIRLAIWVLGISALDAISATAVQSTYSSPGQVASYGPTAGESAASRITSGRQTALDTIGGIVANETTLTATLGVTLMVVFTVIRHTRAEEESGAAELLRAGVLGRHAALVAALAVAVGASLLVGLLHTLAYVATGLDRVGSIAFGAEIALLGILFAGVAAAAAQVTTSARGALAIAGGFLGAAYIVRGVGAVGENALYWISPFGWAQGVNAFGDERWWLLGVVALAAVSCFAIAATLTARRDTGAGLLQPRPGNPRASAALGSPEGLALRTQRGLLLGWATGLLVLAAIYGSVIPEVPDMLTGNPELAEMMGLGADGEDRLIDAFLGYVNLTLGVIGAVFGVASVLRLRAEEEAGRLEALLATRLTRVRWLAGSLAVTLAGVVLMAVAMGVGMVLGYVPIAGDGSLATRLFLGPLGQLPAMVLVAVLAFLIVAWLPRWSVFAWLVVVAVVLEAFLAETLSLPQWLRALSPFHHLPLYPSEDWSVGPALALLAVAVLAVVAGVVGYRRRDVG